MTLRIFPEIVYSFKCQDRRIKRGFYEVGPIKRGSIIYGNYSLLEADTGYKNEIKLHVSDVG